MPYSFFKIVQPLPVLYRMDATGLRVSSEMLMAMSAMESVLILIIVMAVAVTISPLLMALKLSRRMLFSS